MISQPHRGVLSWLPEEVRQPSRIMGIRREWNIRKMFPAKNFDRTTVNRDEEWNGEIDSVDEICFDNRP